MLELNFVAVVVAAVVNYLVGLVWYHPHVFGGMWGREVEQKKACESTPTHYFWGVVLSLLFAAGIGHFILHTGATNYHEGFLVAIYAWLGFVIPLVFNGCVWCNKPANVGFVKAGRYLVGLLAMSAVFIWIQGR